VAFPERFGCIDDGRALLAFQARRDRRRTGRQQIAAAVEEAGLPY